MAQKMTLYLVNMKCQVMKKGGLYGIIRLDTLPRVSAPVVNTGQTLNQKLIIGGEEARNKAKVENINLCVFGQNVSFGGLLFNNTKRCILSRKPTRCQLNLKAMTENKLLIEILKNLMMIMMMKFKIYGHRHYVLVIKYYIIT